MCGVKIKPYSLTSGDIFKLWITFLCWGMWRDRRWVGLSSFDFPLISLGQFFLHSGGFFTKTVLSSHFWKSFHTCPDDSAGYGVLFCVYVSEKLLNNHIYIILYIVIWVYSSPDVLLSNKKWYVSFNQYRKTFWHWFWVSGSNELEDIDKEFLIFY